MFGDGLMENNVLIPILGLFSFIFCDCKIYESRLNETKQVLNTTSKYGVHRV